MRYAVRNYNISAGTTGKGLATSKPVSSYFSLPVHPFPVVVLQFEAPTTSRATFRALLTVSLRL